MTDSKCEIDTYGTSRWRNEKRELHRLDGPAVEQSSGYKGWFVGGKLHRLDGPAIEWPSGFALWPAGRNLWAIDDAELTAEQFEQHPLVIFYQLSKAL
jgi:hypothetical protein